MRKTYVKACSLAGLMVAAMAMAMAGPGQAQELPSEIRIGWAISKTGPYAGGASTTVTPNYEMWKAELEKAGGMEVAGKKIPVRFFEYDDRSSSEEAVRAVERLINHDKVDFVLPPWGTAMNLAVGPILDRHGYPHLATTMISDRIPELRERWPNMFFFTLTSSDYARGVVALLGKMRAAGQIQGRVAVVNVADQFGIELGKAGREALDKAGFERVYDQSYPMGTQEFQPLLSEIKRRQPEVLLAFSYPPDTLALSDQSRAVGFNPKVLYTAIGTAFPVFRERLGANAQGVLGLGGVSAELPVTRAYRERHLQMFHKEADYNGSAVTYATLQVLQQAIARTRSVDRKTVSADIRNGVFDTVVGRFKLQNRVWSEASLVGQWQGGVFQPVAPDQAIGFKPIQAPKPAWKP
ncbi:amino acid ABC transporter substrate-binding protein [Comamonas composti]|uniref:amino acid ABC transporter substrate-binding protein n=1 Tax=Comamonas composti TaxID=408558 RepID=UPI000402C67B|nr:amino acid ABC transporter substrate-binding protein [Comamonas composti]